MVVSIQPLKYIVDSIVGDDFKVEVLVPPGASPETYEPTPTQIKASESAKMLFYTGLIDFEQALVGKLASDNERFIDLSGGIELIEGSCRHEHSGRHKHSYVARQGIDPHIWTSPRALRKMASTVYRHIHALYPDSVSYTVNYQSLDARLTELDSNVGSRVADSGRSSFVIFHPGLTYYARDYGLTQIALEHEGKEPSAKQLRSALEQAKEQRVANVLYQKEFPRNVVEVAANEIGAKPVEIDILGYDIIDNILKITELIAEE